MTYPIDQSIKSEQPRTELEHRVAQLEERVEALEQAQRDRVEGLKYLLAKQATYDEIAELLAKDSYSLIVESK